MKLLWEYISFIDKTKKDRKYINNSFCEIIQRSLSAGVLDISKKKKRPHTLPISG